MASRVDVAPCPTDGQTFSRARAGAGQSAVDRQEGPRTSPTCRADPAACSCTRQPYPPHPPVLIERPHQAPHTGRGSPERNATACREGARTRVRGWLETGQRVARPRGAVLGSNGPRFSGVLLSLSTAQGPNMSWLQLLQQPVARVPRRMTGMRRSGRDQCPQRTQTGLESTSTRSYHTHTHS